MAKQLTPEAKAFANELKLREGRDKKGDGVSGRKRNLRRIARDADVSVLTAKKITGHPDHDNIEEPTARRFIETMNPEAFDEFWALCK